MIRFYFHPTPNPAKVALLLEETGLRYETIPVDTRPTVTEEGKKILFGQTAATVRR